ncbi:MAG: S-adenosylmethionine:tRNA ribosyltransferase-isomerase [Chitinophagaceae bacterium]|nr:S-adenosylmethionine:tRNA ribosyltransferase-isomerase [Chitinophagaceae bacterium]
MHPKYLSITYFSYLLPEERIAKYPLAERDASKLLVFQNGQLKDDTYRNIAAHIPAGSLLIFNNTKVVEARLVFQKITGGQIEIFCLEPHEQYPDITSAMLQQEKVQWLCLVGGASKWKKGQVLEKKVTIAGKEIMLSANYVEKRADCFVIELSWLPGSLSFAEILHYTGAIPLPPYIKRAVESDDADRYQTIYAHFDGSVAAPTAGLHFTNHIFRQLEEKSIKKDFVTLHVGAGTFKPVKAAIMEEHEMHAEFIDIKKSLIENLVTNLDRNIIAVGTTSLRTIESLYWLGVKTVMDPAILPSALLLTQWEAYELSEQNIPVKEALTALLKWMEQNSTDRLLTKTQIIIAPGYTIRIAKALITNFHQPQSTLLLLVAALTGDQWRNIYDHALKNNYRFLSYGDGSLLWTLKD